MSRNSGERATGEEDGRTADDPRTPGDDRQTTEDDRRASGDQRRTTEDDQQTTGDDHRTTERTEVRSALLGEDLEIGYPTTDEPVVECERIDVPEGEITALVGPNGSGKSTLLKALSDHLEPEAGVVELDGRDVREFDGKELARELGHLSQENDSPGSITVEELVYHGRYPHRGFFDAVTAADHEAVERAIDLAGVEDLRDREVGALSGGQKQLVWIAMVLAQETDVLLLDEPTTFLDLHHQFRVLETIGRLNEEQGVTVAVVLHDLSQAVRFADYLVAMDDGGIYDWGPPEDVVTEQLLEDVFDVEATVTRSPELHIRPQRALDSE